MTNMRSESSLFVDTSGWANIVHRQDPFHAEADRIYQEAYSQGRGLFTTDYVISELVPLLSSHYRLARPLVIAAIDVLMADKHITLLRTDPDTFDEAWNLLKRRQDKEWSLTDAVSIVFMRRLGLVNALTNDHHFEQAGYVRLLKP